MMRTTRMSENATRDEHNCTVMSELENERIARRSFREASEREDHDLCSSLKLSLIRCCTFTYRNNSQLAANISFALIFIFGLIKVILGANAISHGRAAIFLAKYELLLWAGVFLLLVGISSLIFSIAAFRSIYNKPWSSVTAKPFVLLIIGMIYIVLFDVIVIIMVSGKSNEDFSSSIQTNMKDTLNDKYGVSSSDFMVRWDELQRQSQCCGATSFEEWFSSVWADEIKTFTNSSSPLLPLSCLFEKVPFGGCTALSISLSNPISSYLSIGNYSLVSVCDPFATSQEGVAYAYGLSCFPVYFRFLVDEMQSIMRIVIGLMATDITIIIALASIGCKLPFKHRVNEYNPHFDPS